MHPEHGSSDYLQVWNLVHWRFSGKVELREKPCRLCDIAFSCGAMLGIPLNLQTNLGVLAEQMLLEKV